MSEQRIQVELSQIAKVTLHLETLETRNSDRLDFTDVAVWAIKDALRQAYAAGQRNPTEGK
jgi:hypothetical protein